MFRALASTATVTDIDFSKYDLDQPLPRLTTNGEQGSLDKFAQWGSGKTLRQLAMERFGAVPSDVEFIGSPATVARAVPPFVDSKQALEDDLSLEVAQLDQYRDRVRQATDLGLVDVAEALRPLLTETQEHVRDLQSALGK